MSVGVCPWQENSAVWFGAWFCWRLHRRYQCPGALVPWCPGALVDTVCSYAVGFIFTSLPPMLLALARESIQTLNGEEGRVLRTKHQRNVKLLHQMLMDSVHKKENPINFGCYISSLKKVCDIMMSRYHIYVQDINYPMVARGEEGLRIAPTPHHTPQIMQYFFEHLVKAWKEVGLELKLHSSGECNFCQQPLDFELMTEREKSSP
uniref:Aminotransferase class I/classII large domain-containing protein n=1 Tax=Oncorhynchus kisutch TaxID=8019 RepID=A0A8C7DDF6_ONCKI